MTTRTQRHSRSLILHQAARKRNALELPRSGPSSTSYVPGLPESKEGLDWSVICSLCSLLLLNCHCFTNICTSSNTTSFFISVLLSLFSSFILALGQIHPFRATVCVDASTFQSKHFIAIPASLAQHLVFLYFNSRQYLLGLSR